MKGWIETKDLLGKEMSIQVANITFVFPREDHELQTKICKSGSGFIISAEPYSIIMQKIAEANK